jgi:hypothetical protein
MRVAKSGPSFKTRRAATLTLRMKNKRYPSPPFTMLGVLAPDLNLTRAKGATR